MAAGQPLSRAEVELILDFEGLSEELREGLERRVKAAAAVAAKELSKVEKAAAGIGTETQRSGRVAETSIAAIQRGAKAASTALDKSARSAASVGAASKSAARELSAAADAAKDIQSALFDIDNGEIVNIVDVSRAVEAVQQSLFDLDTVTIERVTRASDEASQSIDRRLVPSVSRMREAIANIGAGGRGGISALVRDLAGLPPAGEQSVRGLTLTRRAILSVIAAGVGIAPTFAAAGAGVGAFGLFAVPPIQKVIAAQTEMGDTWGALSNDQKIAAASTAALVTEYKALSASLAPDTLRVYNAALTETRELLPELVPLARSVTAALTDAVNTLGDGFDSDTAQEFFSFLEQSAPGAIGGLVSIVQEGGAAAAALIQALAPLAPVLGAVVSGTLQLVTAVAELSPELLQLLVTAVALRGPVAAIGSAFTAGVGRAKTFTAATKGASLASRALTAAASAGPNIYLAGAAALGVLALSLATAKTKGEELVDSIQAQNLAIRNNVAGYQNANKVLAAQLAPTEVAIGKAIQDLNRDLNANTVAFAEAALGQRGLQTENLAAINAMEANKVALKNISAGAQAVASTYGITTKQAIALSDAIGVDLSSGITENGIITASAAGKFAAYNAAVEAARNPTVAISTAFADAANAGLLLTDRVKGLQAAFDLTINPSLALFTATTRVKEAFSAATTALREGDVTLASRRTLLQNMIGTLRDQANAEFVANQNVDRTSAAFRNQLPVLTTLAGKNTEFKGLVNELKGALSGAQIAADNAGTSLGVLSGKTDAAKTSVFNAGISLSGLGSKARGAQEGISEAARQAGVLGTRSQGASGKVGTLAVEAQQVGAASSAASGKVAGLATDINSLKSKNVQVTANTAPARSSIQSLLQFIGAQSASVSVGVLKPRGATGGLVTGGVIVPQFAYGGLNGKVRGPGGPRSDKVAAWLSNGEYVINARQTARWLPLISAINAGKFADGGMAGGMPKLATGGLITRRSAIIDLGALLGTDLARGLARSQRNIDAELGKVTKKVKESLAEINRSVGGDFVRNLMSASPEEINRQLRDLQRQITSALRKTDTRVDNLLVARLTTLNAALGKLAQERDRIAATLEKATQTASDVAERARSSAALSTLTEEERDSPESIAAGLRDRLKVIDKFRADIAKLERRGTDKSLIEQLVTDGPAQSGQIAATLAKASGSTLKEINSLQQRINATSKVFGKDSADFLYDSGVNAGRGFLTGLKSQEKEIIALMTAIAKSVATTVKKELKIKSPSRVMRPMGRDTGRGYLLGLQDLAPQIEKAARQMVAPLAPAPSPGFRPARETAAASRQPGPRRGHASSSVRDVTFNNTYTQVMANASDIWAEQERQLADALR